MRLLAPISAPGQSWDQTLSSPTVPVGSILNTIGNPAASGACAIGATAPNGTQNVGIAAGRDGAVWVLTGNVDPSTGSTHTDGRELIELRLGSTGQPCPQPSATFDAKVGSTELDASAPITVPVASTIDFDADPVRGGGWAFQYDWDLDGDGTYETASKWNGTFGTALEPTASHQFTSPGVQTVRLRLTGDFGVIERQATVLVQASTPPSAAFSAGASTVTTGDAVSFDASASAPSPQASIVNYHWDFGDGNVEDSQTPSTVHVFDTAGERTVTLTVRGNDNQVSAAATKTVTVKTPTKQDPPVEKPPAQDPTQTTPQPPADPQPKSPALPSNVFSLAGKAKASTAALSLTFPSAGKLSVAATVKVKKTKKTKAKTITFATATKTVTAGSTTIALTPSKAAKTLLKKGPLKLTITATFAPTGGKSATKTTTITIKKTKR